MCIYPVQPVCTFFLHIYVYIIPQSTVYCIAHFIVLHILLWIFSYYFIFLTYIYVYSLVLCYIFFNRLIAASLPANPIFPNPVLQISEEDVRQVFRRNKRRKAPGPDGVTPYCLKTCADQLAPIFTQIFNISLELCEVPSSFKRSTIIPVPKKPKITGFNDYRPVALTSVVMKSFEKLILAYLKNITGPLLDPLQFAYRANRSMDDAVNMGLHYILQHLDKSGTYVRILFVEFSLAFNTIIPTLLQTKLTQLSVASSICQIGSN